MNSTYSPIETTKTKALVINALFIALTLVATMFINIKLPIMGNGGLVHLGNVPLFIAALVYGKKTGAIAGAFGMAFFDLILWLGSMGTVYIRHRRSNGLSSRPYIRKGTGQKRTCIHFGRCPLH